MAIEFPKLPFDLSALEPHISKKTIEFHYGKHHRTYVDTLNELIHGTPLDRKTLEEIMNATCGKKEKIYNNAAQAWNHQFFWNCMAKEPLPASAALKKSIEKKFGSLKDFKNEFNEEGKNLFGSGWVWLTKDKKGRLQLRSSHNAFNPLQDGETPLLTCDVWEHAYYLDYQNERPKYLDHFWSVVNWEFVEFNLERPSQAIRSKIIKIGRHFASKAEIGQQDPTISQKTGINHY